VKYLEILAIAGPVVAMWIRLEGRMSRLEGKTDAIWKIVFNGGGKDVTIKRARD